LKRINSEILVFISCLIYLFIDLYCNKILSEKTKLQHDLQNHLEKKKQLEYDLSSYKKRLAKQNRTGKQMENENPKLKTSEGNTTAYFSKYIMHIEDENEFNKICRRNGITMFQYRSSYRSFFSLVCVYGNTKDHKSNGSADTGPPCNAL